MAIAPKVGDEVFYRTPDGHPHYHQKGVIVGETSKSWLCTWSGAEWWRARPEEIPTRAMKLPKKGTIFLSRELAELQAWAANNRHAIVQRIDRLEDVELLKTIAELIDYIPRNEEKAMADSRTVKKLHDEKGEWIGIEVTEKMTLEEFRAQYPELAAKLSGQDER